LIRENGRVFVQHEANQSGRVELLTGIEGASSRPVRKIVLLGLA
jgi:hypothetical protein